MSNIDATEPTIAEQSRTITLTDAPPVRIRETQWLRIARVDWYQDDDRHNAFRACHLYVRRNREDGRMIVYGIRTSAYEQEPDLKGGELLAAGDDVVAALYRVAATVQASARLVAECVADLPPVEI